MSVDGIVVDGHVPEAVFVYREEAGNPVGAVARFAPGTLEKAKSFRQYRRHGESWVPGLDGGLLPVYRLPEVIAAIREGASIVIVEGEACANAASALGLEATTNSGGAGKWGSHHSAPLAGADIVILPDNDDVGSRHGQQVAELLHGTAKRIRVVELPGLAAHGDIIDWIRSGGTLEALKALVERSHDWQPRVVVDEWPTPAPFAIQSEATPFPIEAGLPAVLSSFVKSASETVKIDPTFPGVLVPVVLSAAAGNTYSMRVSDAHVEPNLSRYAGLFADPGERKSSIFKLVAKPLGEWRGGKLAEYGRQIIAHKSDAKLYGAKARDAENRGAKAETEEDIEKCRAEAQAARAEVSDPPRSPLLTIGDVTPQMLVRLMDECGGGFSVMSADGRHVVEAILGQYRKDNSTDDSVFLRAHAGDCIDRARIGADGQGELRVIEHPSLALGLCLQPDKLRSLSQDGRLMDSGMLQRMSLALPRSLIGTRRETGDEQGLDPEAGAQWSRLIQNIAEDRWQRLPTPAGGKLKVLELRLGPEAARLRRNFANELEERQADGGDLARARGFASKAAGEAARLSGLLHLAVMATGLGLRDEMEVGVDTWRIAEVHQRWQLDETLRSLAITREKQEYALARRVLAWAARHRDLPFLTTRDLIGARIVETAEAAQEALNFLTTMNWLRRAADSRQGGPRWQVHPIVFKEGPP